MTDEMEKALHPNETLPEWVERVTGEVPTANQTAAIADIRSALAGEPDESVIERAAQATKGMEAPEEHTCTSRDPDAEIDGCPVGQECDGYWEAWFRARLRAAYPLIAAKWASEVARLKELVANEYNAHTQTKLEALNLTERLATAERELKANKALLEALGYSTLRGDP